MTKVKVIGSIPFNDLKEKYRLIGELKAEIKKGIKIKIEDNLILYEFSEYVY